MGSKMHTKVATTSQMIEMTTHISKYPCEHVGRDEQQRPKDDHDDGEEGAPLTS
jgi:hypothetical protein